MKNETPIKILYLITKSNLGGAQKYVYELAVAAKEAGHDVSVACGGTGEAGAATGDMAKKITDADIELIEVKNFMRNMSMFRDIKVIYEVWQIIRKEKPDVLHVTSSKAGGIGAFTGRLAGVPNIIFTSHGLTYDESWRPGWQRFLIKLFTWLTITLSHKSIMISTSTYDRARQLWFVKNKVSLVFNGIHPINFLDKSEARTFLAPEVDQNAFWIGGIGELHPNKNWSSVILAIKKLPSNTHLMIIGEGEEREKLEKLIAENELKDRVHLLGYKLGAPYLKAFDIFVLTSHKEGLPYVLLEAGQAGCAIVASDIHGNRDIIKHKHNGLLATPDADSIASTLKILIENESTRANYSNKIQADIKNQFSIEKMVEETFSLYNN